MTANVSRDGPIESLENSPKTLQIFSNVPISKPVNALDEFDDFRLETSERVLRHDGSAVPLTPKASDTSRWSLLHVRNG